MHDVAMRRHTLAGSDLTVQRIPCSLAGRRPEDLERHRATTCRRVVVLGAPNLGVSTVAYHVLEAEAPGKQIGHVRRILAIAPRRGAKTQP